MRIALLTLALVLAAGSARADDSLCAQRPGKATPPCVLDAGQAQIEVGLADAVFLRNAGVHEDTYALGAAELRLGLTKRLEIEAGWSPMIVDTVRGERRTGSGDATLALLGALIKPEGDGLAVSAQGFVTLPTATHGLGAGGWTGGLRLPVSIASGDNGFGLTPEVDLLRNANGSGVHAAWVGVGAVSHTFSTSKTTLGAELWGEVEEEPTGSIRRASADLTAAVVIGENVQFDAGANFGLNHATPNAEVYVGVTRRF